MNEITCTICGQQVSKRSTLAVGDGKRACRSHKGVEQQAVNKQVQAKQQKQRQQEKRQRNVPKLTFKPQCSKCGCEGMISQEFYTRILILTEKFELIYGRSVSLFSEPEDKAIAYKELQGVNCLWQVPYDPHNIFLPKRNKMVAETFGIVLLCGGCCQKCKIDPTPKIDPDTLAAYSSVVDMMRPTFQNLAASEIKDRN